jgi:hypothetical protein
LLAVCLLNHHGLEVVFPNKRASAPGAWLIPDTSWKLRRFHEFPGTGYQPKQQHTDTNNLIPEDIPTYILTLMPTRALACVVLVLVVE